jgi:adenine-specific DNA glycosylase
MAHCITCSGLLRNIRENKSLLEKRKEKTLYHEMDNVPVIRQTDRQASMFLRGLALSLVTWPLKRSRGQVTVMSVHFTRQT